MCICICPSFSHIKRKISRHYEIAPHTECESSLFYLAFQLHGIHTAVFSVLCSLFAPYFSIPLADAPNRLQNITPFAYCYSFWLISVSLFMCMSPRIHLYVDILFANLMWGCTICAFLRYLRCIRCKCVCVFFCIVSIHSSFCWFLVGCCLSMSITCNLLWQVSFALV